MHARHRLALGAVLALALLASGALAQSFNFGVSSGDSRGKGGGTGNPPPAGGPFLLLNDGGRMLFNDGGSVKLNP